MGNKQTAVLFLESFLIGDDEINMKYAKLFQRAKQMERKQIEDAYNQGRTDGAKRMDSKNGSYRDASDYLTKTYQNGENS